MSVAAVAVEHLGGDAQPLGAEIGFAHPRAVVDEIVEGLLGSGAEVGVFPEGSERVVEAALVGAFAAVFSPLSSEVGCGSVEGLAASKRCPLAWKVGHDLNDVGEVLVDEVSDPGDTVAEDSRRRGVGRPDGGELGFACLEGPSGHFAGCVPADEFHIKPAFAFRKQFDQEGD